MTTTLWGQVNGWTVPDDAEAVIASVALVGVELDAAVVLQWRIAAATEDGDADHAVLRIRRHDLAGVAVLTIDPYDPGLGTVALLAAALLPAFDGPGLPSSITYVLTVEMVDATGPSTGTLTFISATY